MKRVIALLFVSALIAVGAGTNSAVGKAPQASTTQIVFSGIGFGSFGGYDTPFGFWIWCETPGGNPYAGETGDCQGSMYFYAIPALPSGTSPTEAVDGTVTVLGTGQWQMSVTNTRGPLEINCTLTNTPPPTHGPTNTIVVLCSAPSGSGSVSNGVVTVGTPG